MSELEPFPIRWNIAGVGEIVGGFGWAEGIEKLADGNVREGIARERVAPAGFTPDVLATFEHAAAAKRPGRGSPATDVQVRTLVRLVSPSPYHWMAHLGSLYGRRYCPNVGTAAGASRRSGVR
jgi:hypothetical protein